MSQTAFSTLNLKPDLLSNLSSLGYEAMTPIQAQSLPHILAGKDVIAQGKTGSGKTAAFGLGLLDHLNVKRFRVQSLVLCPTRELADQVAKEIRKLARAIHNIKVLTCVAECRLARKSARWSTVHILLSAHLAVWKSTFAKVI